MNLDIVSQYVISIAPAAAAVISAAATAIISVRKVKRYGDLTKGSIAKENSELKKALADEIKENAELKKELRETLRKQKKIEE